MPDAKVKVDMWLWPMIGFHPIILVSWTRNGRGYGPRFTVEIRRHPILFYLFIIPPIHHVSFISFPSNTVRLLFSTSKLKV
jgi:hypothetical protein